jgi:sugar O-acyltransferase (sialic acid O-acetyltransferase NeuD family)
MKKAIIGNGSFAKEVYCYIRDNGDMSDIVFFVDDQYKTENCKGLSEFDPENYEVVVAIANPIVREQFVNKLPKNTKYFTMIHKSAQLLDSNIKIGEGSIICANVVLTTNINLGNHAQLNLLSSVGHDCVVGDYFTTAPGAKISGNCCIGNRVYIGTNGSVKEKTKICDDVIIGLNGGVIKDIEIPGTYVGCPTKRIK